MRGECPANIVRVKAERSRLKALGGQLDWTDMHAGEEDIANHSPNNYGREGMRSLPT